MAKRRRDWLLNREQIDRFQSDCQRQARMIGHAEAALLKLKRIREERKKLAELADRLENARLNLGRFVKKHTPGRRVIHLDTGIGHAHPRPKRIPDADSGMWANAVRAMEEG